MKNYKLPVVFVFLFMVTMIVGITVIHLRQDFKNFVPATSSETMAEIG